MKRNLRRTTKVQTVFAGLDRRPGAAAAYAGDMKNLTGDGAALTVRKGRSLVAQIPQFHGMTAYDGGLAWVSGSALVVGGETVGAVEPSDKIFARLGKRLVIFPDKVCWDGETLSPLEAGITTRATFTAYEWNMTSEEAGAVYAGNAIRTAAAAPFNEGDAVEISGAALPENNRSAVIRKILEDGKLLVFTNNLFLEDEAQTVTLRRSVPDLAHLCAKDNRLWGCRGDEIFGSALGLPACWQDFDGNAMSSFSVATGSDGDFTAAGVIGGYTVFFKEDAIYKLYGDRPANFQVLSHAVAGCIDGRSLAVAGETLFYLSRAGIMAYRGGSPVCVSQPLGKSFSRAVAGALGNKYYVNLYDGSVWELYVYDTDTGLWYGQDAVEAAAFAAADGILYMADRQGNLFSLDTADSSAVEWVYETGDLSDNCPDKATLHRVQLGLETAGEAEVWIACDGGGWEFCRRVGAGRSLVGLVPRRCGVCRLRVTGRGFCRLVSLSRTFTPGTEL